MFCIRRSPTNTYISDHFSFFLSEPGADPTLEDKTGHAPHEYAEQVKSYLKGKVDQVDKADLFDMISSEKFNMLLILIE